MSIWTSPITLSDLQKQQVPCLVTHLGIEYIEIGADYIIAKMPVDERTKQPLGLLHGGASVVLAETLGGMAAALSAKPGPLTPVVGVSINANHLKTVDSGTVFGKVTPIRIGKRIQVWHIVITDENNQSICISRLTTMILQDE